MRIMYASPQCLPNFARFTTLTDPTVQGVVYRPQAPRLYHPSARPAHEAVAVFVCGSDVLLNVLADLNQFLSKESTSTSQPREAGNKHLRIQGQEPDTRS